MNSVDAVLVDTLILDFSHPSVGLLEISQSTIQLRIRPFEDGNPNLDADSDDSSQAMRGVSKFKL
jgi:hypothetical protein